MPLKGYYPFPVSVQGTRGGGEVYLIDLGGVSSHSGEGTGPTPGVGSQVRLEATVGTPRQGGGYTSLSFSSLFIPLLQGP